MAFGAVFWLEVGKLIEKMLQRIDTLNFGCVVVRLHEVIESISKRYRSWKSTATKFYRCVPA
jgi:hypothetical protein